MDKNTNLRLLQDYAEAKIRRHPEIRDEVQSLVQLCKDEIEEGRSSDHEVELCMESIFQLGHLLYNEN